MNKKLIRLMLALSVLALPALVQAQFTFTTNNGTITITHYNTAAGRPDDGRQIQLNTMTMFLTQTIQPEKPL